VLLDEPLGLDHEGGNDEREVDFMSALVSAADVQPQCAVVVATRSPKLALFANQVVVLGPKGRVLEQGDPEELLAANGYFAELLQASDEEAAPPAVQQDEAA
jgi:ABC-type multidrug transport system fused ATPase/permease subunit